MRQNVRRQHQKEEVPELLPSEHDFEQAEQERGSGHVRKGNAQKKNREMVASLGAGEKEANESKA